MSRQRNNFIIDKKFLPQEISLIINKNKEDSLSKKINNEENSDNSENKFLKNNVIFHKKPQFLGTPKDYTNKQVSKVIIKKFNL